MYILEFLYGWFEFCFPCCKPKVVYISFEVASDSDAESSSGSEGNPLVTIDPIEELSDSDI